jgi:hypothetical protein
MIFHANFMQTWIAVSKLLYQSRKRESLPESIGKSPLLGRLKSFLPQMAQANDVLKDLKSEERAKLDIECLNDPDAAYVQMDLAVAPTEAVEKLEDAVCGDDDDDDDEEDETEPKKEEEEEEENTKKKRKVLIEEL